MAKFFDLFPKVLYDLDGTRSGNYDIATNIFVRIGVLKSIKQNSSVYYPYLVQDGDTPEMIADKYYGNPEFHWVVLMMNDVVDPFYDWPLDYTRFAKYMIGKYGTIEESQRRVVRYEKQIDRRDSASGLTTTSKMVIDYNTYTALAATTFNSYDLSDGTTVAETITKNAVTAWADELDRNERKRSIKLLKKEYIEVIKKNLDRELSIAPRFPESVLTSR
jgi:hypothetical protein